MQKRVWALLLILAVAAPTCARADETTFGIAITGTHGTHRESDGAATAPLVPAPVLAISHRFKQFEITAEGLPPIGPIRVANNGLGMQNIALNYADATLRYWNHRGTFAVGFGETLYNQRTQFLRFQDQFIRDTDVDNSRVVGTRYEIVGHVPLPALSYLQVQLAVNPALHGRFILEQQTVSLDEGWRDDLTSRPFWERGSQVDADARFVRPLGAVSLAVGVRYLNYTARFTWPRPAFADSNSFLMPYIAVQRSWGH